MINPKLVGKWWAFKQGNIYALFRGDICCSESCVLPNNAITRWIYPENPERGTNSWYRPSPEILDISNIIFPPSKYLEDKAITEIEITSNGDYLIFDPVINFN